MRRLLIAIAILASMGVAVSAYGLWQHYAPLGAAFCNVSETFSCDIVNKSAFSEIGGIPVALVGMVGYAALVVVSVVLIRMMRLPPADAADKRMMLPWVRALLVLALPGLAFQGVYTVIELWWIGAYCLICIASQAIILAIGTCAVLTYRVARRAEAL